VAPAGGFSSTTPDSIMSLNDSEGYASRQGS
jgi:hypothetical protein